MPMMYTGHGDRNMNTKISLAFILYGDARGLPISYVFNLFFVRKKYYLQGNMVFSLKYFIFVVESVAFCYILIKIER